MDTDIRILLMTVIIGSVAFASFGATLYLYAESQQQGRDLRQIQNSLTVIRDDISSTSDTRDLDSMIVDGQTSNDVLFTVGENKIALTLPHDWKFEDRSSEKLGQVNIKSYLLEKYSKEKELSSIIILSDSPVYLTYGGEEDTIENLQYPKVTIGGKEYKVDKYVMGEGSHGSSFSEGNYLIKINETLYFSVIFTSTTRSTFCLNDNIDCGDIEDCVTVDNCSEFDGEEYLSKATTDEQIAEAFKVLEGAVITEVK